MAKTEQQLNEIKEDLKVGITRFEKIELALNTIQISLDNHLKTHMDQKDWAKWLIPVLVSAMSSFIIFGMQYILGR